MKKFIIITFLIYSALCPTISIGQDINSIENDAEKTNTNPKNQTQIHLQINNRI